jgi:hypothetical protein
MSGEEKRESQSRDFAIATAQVELYQALEAHQSDLEIQRDAASGYGLEDRIEATRHVLKWLDHQALEIEPPASPAVQTPPSSPNPPKASRRWISHSGDTPTDLVV